MKQWLLLSIVSALVCFLSGCSSNEQKIMDCANEFARALSSGDVELMKKVYPDYENLYCPMDASNITVKIEVYDSLIANKDNHYFLYLTAAGERLYPTSPLLELVMNEGKAQIINSYNLFTYSDNKKVKEALNLPTKHIMFCEDAVYTGLDKDWASEVSMSSGNLRSDKVFSEGYRQIANAVEIYNKFLKAYKSGDMQTVLKLYPNASQFGNQFRKIDSLPTEIKEIVIELGREKGTYEYIITTGKTHWMDIPGDIDEVVNYEDIEVSPDIIGLKIIGNTVVDSYNLYDYRSLVPEEQWEEILKSDSEGMNLDLKRIELVKTINKQ